MDFRQIQYFVALYEEQSITKAANRLNVVQPAVSMQIRRLESFYNVNLFERTPRGVYPNAIARRLYPLCRDALEKAGALHKILEASSGDAVGTVSIGVPPSIAANMLGRVLIKFHEQSPHVQLRVREGYSANLMASLMDGELDFAVVTPIDNTVRLNSQILGTEEFVVVVKARTFPDATSISGIDLAGLRLIVPSERNMTRPLIDTGFEAAGVGISVAMEVDSLATVFSMIHQPGWASILPMSAALALSRERDVQILKLSKPDLRRSLTVAFHRQRGLSASAQLLISHLEVELATLALDANPPEH
ncbi:LysR family transcriptional regulator [Bradyrhizobium sp. NP1]|uniref:LysR family transcriptional regulator n=1 Tax=Bradyrhizobium sp. NP1 TaxID=3049772 RepID=UPI0025A627A9|nr:LysR family transcriptional regulator [Bradyrhizobium sp. NP1]WJR77441.1 LysR family transcriptional regulator [Bradyrhizobium sp. NP1]